jgi:putative acetyltransferase
MNIIEINEIRTPCLIDQLVQVWEASVRETHLFLSDKEIRIIRNYVPQALREVSRLIVLEDEEKHPVGFMGLEDQKLEMLFLSPEKRRMGFGKKLLVYGMENYSVNELAVNEQNPLAIGFYEHLGFQVYKRSRHDEQGNPYPILYMKRY